MHKLVVRVALFRCGVKKFENDVNKLLDQGWHVEGLNIEKKGFRILCHALLKRNAPCCKS